MLCYRDAILDICMKELVIPAPCGLSHSEVRLLNGKLRETERGEFS